MYINYSEGKLPPDDILSGLEAAAKAVVASEGIDCDVMEVSVTFVNEDEIQEINESHRNISKPTDVLSFPQYESIEDIQSLCNDIIEDKNNEEVHNDMNISIGDIVICREIAHQQAERYNHSIKREFIYLFVHGMYHLLGFDHENEKQRAVMRRREEDILTRIGVQR